MTSRSGLEGRGLGNLLVCLSRQRTRRTWRRWPGWAWRITHAWTFEQVQAPPSPAPLARPLPLAGEVNQSTDCPPLPPAYPQDMKERAGVRVGHAMPAK